jgi:hypothetical protein
VENRLDRGNMKQRADAKLGGKAVILNVDSDKQIVPEE